MAGPSDSLLLDRVSGRVPEGPLQKRGLLLLPSLNVLLFVCPLRSSAAVHQSSRRPNWGLRGRGLIRVPSNRRPQAEGELEQERQEGQLPAHRGGSNRHSNPGLMLHFLQKVTFFCLKVSKNAGK